MTMLLCAASRKIALVVLCCPALKAEISQTDQGRIPRLLADTGDRRYSIAIFLVVAHLLMQGGAAVSEATTSYMKHVGASVIVIPLQFFTFHTRGAAAATIPVARCRAVCCGPRFPEP